MLLSPPLSKLALGFGAPELFSLIPFGADDGELYREWFAGKIFIMATLGMLVSLIGMESVSGYARFTLGSLTLSDGVGLVPVAVGMFGITEILTNLEDISTQELLKAPSLRSLFPTSQDWHDSCKPVLRGTVLGFFLGILPGAGTVTSTFFSYGLEKRLSKHPEKFGTGVIEAVAGPETANNAAVSGAMVPLLALGVPAHVVMAMLLGALIIHGIQPGHFSSPSIPTFSGVLLQVCTRQCDAFSPQPSTHWPLGETIGGSLSGAFPMIILFCFIGVYSLNNNVYEIFYHDHFWLRWLRAQKNGISTRPFFLAMVLGPMMETGFRQSMTISQGDPAIFMERPFPQSF